MSENSIEDERNNGERTINEIADDQIRPDDSDYLDGVDEFEHAVDIGRRILKRDRAGGRPSKVENGLSRIEIVLEGYAGEQRRMLLKNEARDIRTEMSGPTWKKFAERANDLIASELEKPLNVNEAIKPADTV